MALVCEDCEYSATQLLQILVTIYNAFTDSCETNFEAKKCKVLNLFQLYLAPCVDKTRAWKVDVSQCGDFHFLTLIFSVNGFAVNMVVYFDGIGYVLLNQGSCRIKYDNEKRIATSIVQHCLTSSSKPCGKSCELKDNLLYAYDKKCDKVVTECNFDRTPKVNILSPKKCKNVGKSTTLRFDVVDVNSFNSLEYVVFVDDVEYIRLCQVIPVLVHFKCHGKHTITVKVWDICSQKYIADACVDVKVEDKCTSSTTSCSTDTTTSCTTTSTCTTGSSTCEPCKPHKDTSTDSTSTSCTTTSTSCEPCKKQKDTSTESTCSLSEKNIKVISYRSDTTDN